MVEEKISVEMFRRWQKDPVTIELMKVLTAAKNEITETMTNADFIEHADSRAKLMQLVGFKNGLDSVLEIDLADRSVEYEDDTGWL